MQVSGCTPLISVYSHANAPDCSFKRFVNCSCWLGLNLELMYRHLPGLSSTGMVYDPGCSSMVKMRKITHFVLEILLSKFGHIENMFVGT
jgi:hypothetical protein